MININNINYLSYEEQVEKNKEDIAKGKIEIDELKARIIKATRINLGSNTGDIIEIEFNNELFLKKYGNDKTYRISINVLVNEKGSVLNYKKLNSTFIFKESNGDFLYTGFITSLNDDISIISTIEIMVSRTTNTTVFTLFYHSAGPFDRILSGEAFIELLG